jgi:hypothetical protein
VSEQQTPDGVHGTAFPGVPPSMEELERRIRENLAQAGEPQARDWPFDQLVGRMNEDDRRLVPTVPVVRRNAFQKTLEAMFEHYEVTLGCQQRLFGALPKDPNLLPGFLKNATGVDNKQEMTRMLVAYLRREGYDVAADATPEQVDAFVRRSRRRAPARASPATARATSSSSRAAWRR